jgi:hypothetical protein
MSNSGSVAVAQQRPPENEHVVDVDYEEEDYEESPLSYSATMAEMERQPLLQDCDPPPDYTDQGIMDQDELPSYQQVQEESKYS